MVDTASSVISSSGYNQDQQKQTTESFEVTPFSKQASIISVTGEPNPVHTPSGHEPSCRKQDSDFLSLFDGFHKIFSCAPTYFQAQIDTDEETVTETVSTQSELEFVEDTVSEVISDKSELESIFEEHEVEAFGTAENLLIVIDSIFHNLSNNGKITGKEELQMHLFNLKLLSEDLKRSSTYHNTAFIESLERSIKFIHYESENKEGKLESLIGELTSSKDFIAFVNSTKNHAIGELIIKNPNVELGEKEYLKISINKGHGGCDDYCYTCQDFAKNEVAKMIEYPKNGHYDKKLPLLGNDQIVGNCLFIALMEAVRLAASLQSKKFSTLLFTSKADQTPQHNLQQKKRFGAIKRRKHKTMSMDDFRQALHVKFKKYSKLNGKTLKLKYASLYSQHLGAPFNRLIKERTEGIVKNKGLRAGKKTHSLTDLFRKHRDTNFKTIFKIVTEGREKSERDIFDSSFHKANFKAIAESHLHNRTSIMAEYFECIAMRALEYSDQLDLLYDISTSDAFSEDPDVQFAVFNAFTSLNTPSEYSIRNETSPTNEINRKKNYLASKMSNLRHSDGQTLIQYALENGVSTECIKILIRNFKKVDINHGELGAFDTLILALHRGEADLLEELIDHGLDLNNEFYSEHITALHLYVLLKVNCTRMLELLVNNIEDINKKDSDGLTAYDFAVQHGNTETAALLVQHGAKPPVTSYFQEAVQSVFG